MKKNVLIDRPPKRTSSLPLGLKLMSSCLQFALACLVLHHTVEKKKCCICNKSRVIFLFSNKPSDRILNVTVT